MKTMDDNIKIGDACMGFEIVKIGFGEEGFYFYVSDISLDDVLELGRTNNVREGHSPIRMNSEKDIDKYKKAMEKVYG